MSDMGWLALMMIGVFAPLCVVAGISAWADAKAKRDIAIAESQLEAARVSAKTLSSAP